jgi:FkbH-like protein
MGLDYLPWLADLEHPAMPAPAVGPLTVTLYPSGVELPTLTGLIEHLAARFVDEHPHDSLTDLRVAIVVTAATASAESVYAGDDGAIPALVGEVRDLAAAAMHTADVVLVQTLPFGLGGEVVEDANAAIRAVADAPRTAVVALHRVASLDALVAAENFTAVAENLRALGRSERVVQLWTLLVDAAWAHWDLLVPQTVQPKVVATDLDGVLWAGTLVEDGVDAALHSGGALGRLAHTLWRTHLSQLQQRGVLVAALSKNPTSLADEALSGLDPALRLSGLWASPQIDKATALADVLATFDGVSATHLVVVDDNPGQQEQIRAAWPAARVPAVAATPLLVQDLLRQIPTPRGPVTSSDQQRGAYYEAKASGQLVPEVTYLVDPDDPEIVDRLAQLHARTNQFNLTTPRRTAAQLRDLIADPQWSVLAFCVTYHGSSLDEEIIGCAEIHHRDGPAHLDSFLASCRLLWAGTHQRMFDHIRATARTHGHEWLTALWRPNGRNDAYARWFTHIGWSDATADGTDLTFRGSTATRDGETPADLLTVLARYLAGRTPRSTPGLARTRIRAADAAVEVWISGATFRAGLCRADIDVVRAVFGVDPIGEQAGDPTPVAGFWMDRLLTSRAQLAAYLNTLHEPDRAAALAAAGEDYVSVDGIVTARPGTQRLPAVVPHRLAQEYAQHVGGRLPTEVEWEFAARGGDDRWYPWGPQLPDAPWCLPRGSSPCPVDHNQDAAAPFGLVDLVGHVWQWCAGDYRGHPQYRGGDTRANLYFLRTTVRPLEAAEHCGHAVGFRVVRDPGPDDEES